MPLSPDNLPIYLDYHSTTPADPRVIEAMQPYFTEYYGNPHSSHHPYGWIAEEAVEIAREHIADTIKARPNEIIFTSGATESNNMALKGAAAYIGQYKPEKNHIITVATEHKCVLESCRQLEKQGFSLTILPVQTNGLIDIKQLQSSITEQTFLVSVMMVNNEIGTIQPIQEIGDICRQHQIWLHCDAAQAFGKLSLNLQEMPIDLLSISGHKIYAPKGIGALYIRKRSPKIRLLPMISGGGQEQGMRSGTVPVPLAVGLGKAAMIASKENKQEYRRIQQLTDIMLEELLAIDGILLHGSRTHRIAGNINIGVTGIGAGSLISSLKEIAVSSGSACNSSNLAPSYVLRALQVTPEIATNSIRIGIGRFTSEQEIVIALDSIKKHIKKLRGD